MKSSILKILYALFAFTFLVSTAGSVYADVFSFDEVKFEREYSGGGTPQWSQLKFKVVGPRVSGRVYKEVLSFTIDTNNTSQYNRTDIRFKEDWLLNKRWFNSTSKEDAYLGSRPFTTLEKREIFLLSSDERVVLAWIITNASELIEFAINTDRIKKNRSLMQWKRMRKNGFFEDNLRKHFGTIPGIAKQINERDKYARHTQFILKNRIQPALKQLGHYKGAVDGIIGSGTRRAIKDFERSQDIFPDGVLRTKAEYDLLKSAIDKIAKTPQDAQILELRKMLEASEKRVEYLNKLARTRLDLLKDTKTDLDNAKSKNSKLNANLLAVNKKLHSEEQTVRTLRNQLSDIKKTGNPEKLSATEKALQSTQKEVSSLQSEVEFLTSKLKSQSTTYEKKIGDLENKISTLSQESEVEFLTSKLKSQSKSYEKKIGNLENTISTLSQELEIAQNQITANPDKPKEFLLSEEWQQYKQWITPSQMRFCNILHEYEIAREESANSGNQLLQNMAIKQRDKDISALLTSSRTGQAGEGFRNWVSIVQSVFAMDSVNPKTGNTELAAGVILETPCGISVGTGRVLDAVGAAKSEFKYLAFEGDLIFSQLASVRRGDPVLFDGSFARSEAGSSEMFITNELGEEQRLEAYEKPNDAPDMFVDISYLAKL